MIIVDDQLLLRLLQGDNPFPAALRDDPSFVLRTTYGYQFRALHAAAKDTPDGILSGLAHKSTAQDIEVLRRRIRHPEPELAILNPLQSIGAAIQIKQLYHDALITLSVQPRNFAKICEELGIPLLTF
jgi:hypothetical protein